MIRALLGIGVGLFAIYLIAVAALFAVQRSFIFPAPDRPMPAAEGFRLVNYVTADGLTISGLYRPAKPGQPTAVFFHGNGDSLSGSLVATELYAAQGYGLLLHEYRGYGPNPGSPDEAGLYADGRAARDWLAGQGVAHDNQVLIGFSLGTGVAAQLAQETKPAALVLIAPYTSIPDAVSDRFGGLIPAQWLVRDRFETLRKVGRITAPILILHDRDDSSIPVSHGQRLAAAAPQARLVLFSGHDHMLGFSPEAQQTGLSWLGATLGQ